MSAATSTSTVTDDRTAFAGDKPFCDLVMKGEITSGVVYPLAVAALARKYRFKNIGGASAGAIAAAVAAAAEFGRDKDGFQKLVAIVDDVGQRLPTLFQATPPARPLMKAFLAGLGDSSATTKILRVSGILMRGYWRATIAGIIPGLLLALLALLTPTQWSAWAFAAVTLVIGLCVALAARLWRLTATELPAQNFGLCPGVQQVGSTQPALVEWLIERIDDLSGRLAPGQSHADRPLTFGDLDDPARGSARINLEIMTTNLSLGRPHRLPFDTNRFFFREDEFRRLFPGHIVDWMVQKSEPFKDDDSYRYLPDRKHFPVIVGVRMSLSFPLLLAAVPLHSRDFTLEDPAERAKPRPCWFSDGGICSNFPIHFFDGVWPRWPTFGITLEPYDDARHEDSVYLPDSAGAGIEQSLIPILSMKRFFGAILNTMQEWRDNLQSTLSGYRERIVHVRLRPEEGGLNLNMPPDRVRNLAGYGHDAGELLRDEFEWPAHRWKRFLVWVAKLEQLLESMQRAYRESPQHDETLEALVKRFREDAPQYKQTPEWCDAAETNIDALLKLCDQWQSLRGGRIPKPDVDVRISPKT